MDSGHPELVDAPVVAMGASAGSGTSFEFASRFPERTIGLAFQDGAPTTIAAIPDTLLAVPTCLIAASGDDRSVTHYEEALAYVRPRGALWSFVVERGVGHGGGPAIVSSGRLIRSMNAAPATFSACHECVCR